MNSKVISTIAVVVVLLVIGGFIIKGRPASAPTNTNTTPSEAAITEASPVAATPVASQNTLQNLLKAGIAQKCTFSDTVQNGVSQGVFYVASGKARGDFSVTVSGQPTNSHMIVDGQTSYIWTDNLAAGVKMTLTASPTPAAGGASQQFDANKEINYQCGAWVADSSLFVPPSNVTFSDLSALVPNIPKAALPTVPTE